jgi:hypothetical protein
MADKSPPSLQVAHWEGGGVEARPWIPAGYRLAIAPRNCQTVAELSCGVERRRMANVYIEARPKARPEGSHIADYVVEDHADHVLSTHKIQREATDWAQKQGHSPLVARVRHLNDKKKPDHWRSA